MANVFDYLKTKTQLSRNAFDLSQRHIFNARCSLVQPVFCIDCLPGDYHDIDLISLTRTLPVQTDAFARMKQQFTFVYVPYQQIWSHWNDFILQNQENFSDVSAPSALTTAPCVSLTSVLVNILDSYLDYLNGTIDDSTVDWYGYDLAHFAVRLLDMLGYGTYYEMLDRLDNPVTDLDTDYASIVANIKAAFGDPSTSAGWTTCVKINPWRIFAYQKACNDYFRNQYYTQSNSALFNFDTFDPANAFTYASTYAAKVSDALLYPWYSPYKRDMFTGLMSSPQFGLVSSVDLEHINIVNENSFSTAQSAYVANTNQTRPSALRASASDANYNWKISNAFDVYQLRKAEMLQRWKEDRLRAGNKNKNISKVIFGTESRYLMDHYSDFVGQFEGNMSIDEVLNLSAQGSAELGEIAGKSVGTTTGHLTYKTEEFGCLICLYNVLPIAEYDAIGLDKNNTLLEPFDYFEPHFENLGFDGVYGYQLSNKIGVAQNILAKTLGYAPRFLNYKTAVDKVHGEFQLYGHGKYGKDSGSLYQWTTPRVDIESQFYTSSGISERFFYVDPSVLDPIFKTAIDGSPVTDQFLVNANFSIKSVRNLSVLGLPRW